MDAFEVLIKEIDEKVNQVREYVSDGKADSIEDYKRLSGEIKGLLTARGYAIDLKQRMESADD
jgi:hypothetical protein